MMVIFSFFLILIFRLISGVYYYLESPLAYKNSGVNFFLFCFDCNPKLYPNPDNLYILKPRTCTCALFVFCLHTVIGTCQNFLILYENVDFAMPIMTKKFYFFYGLINFYTTKLLFSFSPSVLIKTNFIFFNSALKLPAVLDLRNIDIVLACYINLYTTETITIGHFLSYCNYDIFRIISGDSQSTYIPMFDGTRYISPIHDNYNLEYLLITIDVGAILGTLAY